MFGSNLYLLWCLHRCLAVSPVLYVFYSLSVSFIVIVSDPSFVRADAIFMYFILDIETSNALWLVLYQKRILNTISRTKLKTSDIYSFFLLDAFSERIFLLHEDLYVFWFFLDMWLFWKFSESEQLFPIYKSSNGKLKKIIGKFDRSSSSIIIGCM